jgi:hypothetical protein
MLQHKPSEYTSKTLGNTCEFGSIPHEKPVLIKIEMITNDPPHPMAQHCSEWLSPKLQKKISDKNHT